MTAGALPPGEDALSPAPVPARECPLPYGLEWGELRPCLPEFHRGSRALATYELRGMRKGANTCVRTLEYCATDGEIRSVEVFLKQVNSPAEREKHAFLQAAGIPVPRLLQVISQAHAEVLAFEFLPRIGIESSEADNLLGLIARLNAVDAPENGIFRPPPGRPEAEFDGRIIAALHQIAVPDPPRWFAAYKEVAEQVRSVPAALNHGELYFQQVGWSGRRLVLLDLDTVAWRPRFTDAAGVIGPLSRRTGRSEADLLSAYLQACASGLDAAQAYRELRSVRLVTAFWSLPWRLELTDDPRIVQEMSSDLRALGF